MVIQSTIGGTTPDYTTTIAWEADKEGVLTDIQEGLLRNVADAGGLVIQGSTTDASNFFRLTYDTGAQTDYTRGSGARLIKTGSGHVIQVGDPFTEFVGLEISNTTGSNSDEGIRLLLGADDLLIDGCFIYDLNDNDNQDGIYIAGADVSNIRIQNTVIVDCNRGGIMIQADDSGNTSWKIYNCVILKCGAGTSLLHGGGIIWQGDTGATIDWEIVNTISMTLETDAVDYGEATAAQIMPTTIGSDNNADVDATMPQDGSSNKQNRTLTDNGSPGAGDWIIITTNTAGSEDVHLQDVAENDATTSGVGPATDGDVPTKDFEGNTRSGTTCDIGPHEVTVAAGGVGHGYLAGQYRQRRLRPILIR